MNLSLILANSVFSQTSALVFPNPGLPCLLISVGGNVSGFGSVFSGFAVAVLFKVLSARVGVFFIGGAETTGFSCSAFLDSTSGMLFNGVSAVVGILLMDPSGSMTFLGPPSAFI